MQSTPNLPEGLESIIQTIFAAKDSETQGPLLTRVNKLVANYANNTEFTYTLDERKVTLTFPLTEEAINELKSAKD